VPLAKIASKVMAGKKLKDLNIMDPMGGLNYTSVKESVLPFTRFSGVDILLGPEMMSTGEVMGMDRDFGIAFAKAQAGAGQTLPLEGKVFISVQDSDKRNIVFIAKKLFDFGFDIMATEGTAKVLKSNNIEVQVVKKMHEGRPNIYEKIKHGDIALIINTSSGEKPHEDGVVIRSTAIMRGIPCITTISGAQASVNGIESAIKHEFNVNSLQDYYAAG
jgi:carbamoyl-phosphate synthase large subunit